jgi:peptidyl-prolyl cis-trans isomerase C
VAEHDWPEVSMACRYDRLIASAVLAILTPVAVIAQVDSLNPAGSASRAPVTGTDPVLGSVDGKLIYLSDLTRATGTLPEQLRTLPFESIMPALLDRLIDHDALTMTARRARLDKKPDIQRDMQAAADLVLERAWLARITPSKVNDAAIQGRFNREYANRPAVDEVRARHILVGSEAEAKSVLEELKGGADFTTIARVVSKDPDGKQGGDLGFFRRDQVWPNFADVAFSLRPGEFGPVPIHNEFGWHIVKVEERRLVAAPALSEVRDKIRRDLTAEAVQDAIAEARGQMIIRKFNLDGSELQMDPRATRAEP